MNRPALVPELYVSNLAASLEFYVGLLGFRVEYERPDENFAALLLGTAHLMLEQAPSLTRATEDAQCDCLFTKRPIAWEVPPDGSVSS